MNYPAKTGCIRHRQHQRLQLFGIPGNAYSILNAGCHGFAVVRVVIVLVTACLLLGQVPIAQADGNCPMLPVSDQTDSDADGVGDVCDNCINAPNGPLLPDAGGNVQHDTDADGYGNLCDGDLNNEGNTNTLDLNLYKLAHRSRAGDANYNADADFNGDGVINTLDLNIYKGLHRKPPGPTGLTPKLDNRRPLADAGLPQTVSVGETVQLDGTDSMDPDGDQLGYRWSLLSYPAGSAAEISDPWSPAPTFVADLAGSYLVELLVSDGTAVSSGDTVLVGSVNQWDITVDPQGGNFTLPNGLVLDIPAGAVQEAVTLSIGDISCDELDALFAAQSITSHDKRCLGGFSGAPDGFTFDVPIKATVPVTLLQAEEIPIWLTADAGLQDYSLIPTELIYRGEQAVVEATLQHFSVVASAAAKGKADPPANDPLPLPPCCSQTPTPLDCCCTTVEVRISEGDTSGTGCDCQLVGQNLEVTFINCPGAPGQVVAEFDSSGECPVNLQGGITPANPTLWACQALPVEAGLTGTNEDGSICNLLLPVNWEVAAPEIAEQQGTGPNSANVLGISAGSTTLSARSLVGDEFSIDTLLSVVLLDGGWDAVEVGVQLCSSGGESWTEEDAIQGSVDMDTAGCSSMSIDTSVPGAAPLSGTFSETGNPALPFSYNIGLQNSPNTVDCVIFFQSNGQDIGFGDPVCPPDATCVPLACTESVNSTGHIGSADTMGAQGTSEWDFSASWITNYDDGSSVTDSVSCSGSSDIGLFKQ